MAAQGLRCADPLGWGEISVVTEYLIPALIGTLLGFLSGLGTGGGSLLILWLTLVTDMAQQEARLINLMFFIPSALIACLFRLRQGTLPLRKVLPAIAAGCLAAWLASMLSETLPLEPLKKLFGGLLIFTGLRELFYRQRKAR